MLISFKCPHCQAALQAGSDFAGKDGNCPHCKKKVTVPEKNSGTEKEGEKTAKKA
jgi:DNA-directed RNA polymerase subunit RPC12/RpoP